MLLSDRSRSVTNAALRLRASCQGAGDNLIDVFYSLRTRYVFRLFDAVMTAPGSLRRPDIKGATPSVNDMGNHRRVQTIVTFAMKVAPYQVGHAVKQLYRISNLPFIHGEVELLGYGSGSTVFLLQPARNAPSNTPLVLKVYRKSVGRDISFNLKLAHDLRAKSEMVAAWYDDASLGGMPRFVILNGPLLGRSAVAYLQTYIGPEKQDLFNPRVQADLPRLLREDDLLRAQVSIFVRRTFEMISAHHLCVDIVGTGNLVIIKSEGSFELILIDHGLLDLRKLAAEAPDQLAIAHERLLRLKELLQEVSCELPIKS